LILPENFSQRTVGVTFCELVGSTTSPGAFWPGCDPAPVSILDALYDVGERWISGYAEIFKTNWKGTETKIASIP
jgi:hypothetical protein